jgi:hypothetical protein
LLLLRLPSLIVSAVTVMPVQVGPVHRRASVTSDGSRDLNEGRKFSCQLWRAFVCIALMASEFDPSTRITLPKCQNKAIRRQSSCQGTAHGHKRPHWHLLPFPDTDRHTGFRVVSGARLQTKLSSFMIISWYSRTGLGQHRARAFRA